LAFAKAQPSLIAPQWPAAAALEAKVPVPSPEIASAATLASSVTRKDRIINSYFSNHRQVPWWVNDGTLFSASQKH
jgi:hypothetical protein